MLLRLLRYLLESGTSRMTFVTSDPREACVNTSNVVYARSDSNTSHLDPGTFWTHLDWNQLDSDRSNLMKCCQIVIHLRISNLPRTTNHAQLEYIWWLLDVTRIIPGIWNQHTFDHQPCANMLSELTSVVYAHMNWNPDVFGCVQIVAFMAWSMFV